MSGILGEIEDLEDELEDLGGDTYDPTDEFDGEVIEQEIDPIDLPDPDPEPRSLTAREWGIYGQGPPELVDDFTSALNAGRIGGVPVRLRPDYSDDWGDPQMAHAKSAQKPAPRNRYLYAKVDMTPASMVRLQGEIGEVMSGTPAGEFMADHDEQKVSTYADRFEQGDRPGAFTIELETDGSLSNLQEGRHRALAAQEAGIDWVPAVILWETVGTYSDLMGEEGKDYIKQFPEGET